MKEIVFKATVVAKEILLNKVVKHFAIIKDLRWESHCFLNEQYLKGILREPDGKSVFLFSFGSIVFINCEHHEKVDILNYLNNIEGFVSENNAFKYIDDYKLTIDDSAEFDELTSDSMTTPVLSDYQIEIIATVLAKSVALEKLEESIDVLMDEIENIIQLLKNDKLATSDKRIANLSARIMDFKILSILHLGILDKPDITWNNDEASFLFANMSKLFELDERNINNESKVATLMDIVQVFSNLVHARRGNRLEWAVIILIAIEVVLSLLEMFVLR